MLFSAEYHILAVQRPTQDVLPLGLLIRDILLAPDCHLSMTENYTTSTALLEALELAGVSHLFCNLGSDHPAILEAISKRNAESNPMKVRFITAPHEFVGLSAAQGFFQASGRMQAILVHVDAGTLSMAGAIHNVSRARIPVLMIAGTSPVTDEGEAVGSRNVSR
jgi:acetolactate synthase-1/2/3 large subunit